MPSLQPARLERLRGRMAGAGCGLVALGPGDDFRYLCGWSPLADERLCLLLVTADRHAVVAPRLNLEAIRQTVDAPVFAYGDADDPASALLDALAFLGGPGEFVAVSDDLRADHLLLLQKHLPHARWRAASTLLAPLRARKDPSEVEALRRAARVADEGVQAAFRACRVGASEVEVAEAARAAMAASGAEHVPFVLVASGPNTALPHHTPGGRRLQPAEPVLVDLGARVDGYCSDVTRVGFLGEPTRRFWEVWEVVDRALRAALAAARPGVPASEVDRAARQVIEAAGYGARFVHRTGHGLGLSVHEPPSLHTTNPEVLEVGMAFTVEPGIYLPGEFGIRLEEAVVLGPSGPEVLSHLPRDVAILRGT
ncbi:MAG: Xaa-Pro peptidase family protein [Firmicutes bacterium]|nr:Xaa-Pro peptidase family protein [Bacillota bacterium]